ncbi:hypothetical protein CAEBREN_13196 [Caenorhabditis brenneri]|uniref:DUF281 domain-containing protein n=1 Tax=Caenorhabditis brenneri TaxID=135651 RepID=G0NJC6_CAEBE|nr:hypothetical protein CAEBREN_13196 [Caenorhabditis brenneri]
MACLGNNCIGSGECWDVREFREQITRLDCPYTDCKPLCGTCDIAAWAPTGLPAGQSFEYSILPGPGGCIGGSATCKRSDDLICSSISLLGPGGVTIASQTNTGTVIANLACQGDGTFTGNGVTGINQLSCVFTDCVAPCKSCNTAALLPTNPPADVSIINEDVAIIPCKISQVTCKNANDLICEKITITGTTAIGGDVILSESMNAQTNLVYLDCQLDATIQEINGLAVTAVNCQLTNCKPPCETCDCTQYAPTSTPADSSFTYVKTAAPGTCTTVEVTCKRTDTQVCDIGIRMVGYPNFASGTQVDSVSALLTCDNNGQFTYGGTTIDMELACVYTNCADARSHPPIITLPEACTTCNTAALLPTNIPPEYTFEIEEYLVPCKVSLITCKRTDDQVCETVEITATTLSGTPITSSNSNSGFASLDLECQNDGTFKNSALTETVTGLTCELVNCRQPCQTCDLTLAAPQNLPAGSTFEFTELAAPGACKETEITCKRTDNQVCDIGIRMVGNPDFAAGSQVDSVSTILTCDVTGNYFFGATVIDTQLACVYNNCAEKCSTCDINAIVPVMNPGTTFVTEELSPPGTCKDTSITCKRTDTLQCTSISIIATTTGPDVTVTTGFGSPGNPITSVSAVLSCNPDGKYEVLDQGTDAAGCKKITFRASRTDTDFCVFLDLTATTPGGTINIKDGNEDTAAYADLTCAADGTYSHNGVSGITAITFNTLCF